MACQFKFPFNVQLSMIKHWSLKGSNAFTDLHEQSRPLVGISVLYRVASKSIWTPQAYLMDIVHPKIKILSFTRPDVVLNVIFFSGTCFCPMEVNGFQTTLDKIWTKRHFFLFHIRNNVIKAGKETRVNK